MAVMENVLRYLQQIIAAARDFVTALGDLLFPRACAGCGRWDAALCPQCAGVFGLEWENAAAYAPFLQRVSAIDGSVVPAFACWALARYRGAVRAVIVRWKHSYALALDQQVLALWRRALQSLPPLFGGALSVWDDGVRVPVQVGRSPPKSDSASSASARTHSFEQSQSAFSVCVVPAPSRWQRRHAGRLVAAKLARAVATEWGCVYQDVLRVSCTNIAMSDLIPRGVALLRRHFGGQKHYQVASRTLRARKRSRIYAKRPLDGWQVVIVDDVVTTGATLSGVASAVESAGGTVIGAVVLAAASAACLT